MSDSMIPLATPPKFVMLNAEGQISWGVCSPRCTSPLPTDVYRVTSTDDDGSWITCMRTGDKVWLYHSRLIPVEQNAATGNWEKVA